MTQSYSQRQPAPGAKGSTTLVLVALGLALVAVLLTNFYIESVRTAVRRSSFTVYVLTRRVLPGDRIKADDVKPVSVPKDFADSFLALNAVDEPGLQTKITNNETVRQAASTGSVLTYSIFAAPGNADLDRDITPGKRLIALPVDGRKVPIELRPGQYVDLQGALNTGGAVPTVLPVMEYVRVLAVGMRTLSDERDTEAGHNRPMGSVRTISIEVTPDEASSLDTIERVMVGDFTLLLRNPTDSLATQIRSGGINQAVLDLVGIKQREPAPPKR